MSRISQLMGPKSSHVTWISICAKTTPPRFVLLADCIGGSKSYKKVTNKCEWKFAASAHLPCVLPTMHRSVFHSSAKPRWVRVRSIGCRLQSIHWYIIYSTSMLLSCVHRDGCDSPFLSSVAEGFHATTSRFSPPASKPHTCSYWIFHKELFYCDSSNPEPFTMVMSYLLAMSAHF